MRSTKQLSVTLPVEMAVESSLREDIAPIYDAMQADPGRARSIKAVKSALAAEHGRHQ